MIKRCPLFTSNNLFLKGLKMQNLAKHAAQNLAAVREKRPLIHNITNYVVMNYTANALLAAGASPVMAHSPDEVEEMVSLANALVINIGTLSEAWIASMIKAGKKASELGKPIILDPVGSGATAYRTLSCKKIIQETKISVIRGNASEILSLIEKDAKTKGVDSTNSVSDASDAAKQIARQFKTTAVITGQQDFVTDGERIFRISNGHFMMGSITGTGCTATALIGAFSAVDSDSTRAAATALAFFGLAGEVAAQKASAPGSFMIALLDALYTITPEQLEIGCKIEN
jgi:hydroxyethylthiazole kinase